MASRSLEREDVCKRKLDLYQIVNHDLRRKCMFLYSLVSICHLTKQAYDSYVTDMSTPNSVFSLMGLPIGFLLNNLKGSGPYSAPEGSPS